MILAGQEVDIGEIVLHHTADAYSIDFYPMYAAESGGKSLVEGKKATFDSPAGQSVAQFWHTIYAGGLAGKEAYKGDAFADGVAAMATVGPWAISVYKGKVDWGVVPVPTSQAGGHNATVILRPFEPSRAL